MIKIKINQYKNIFEVMYKNNQRADLREVENVINIFNLDTQEFSLNKARFYSSKNVVTIDNSRETLIGHVESNNLKHLYISYMTLDNRFDELPDMSLLDLDKFNKYQFNIVYASDDTLDVIPYIIHYRNSKKHKLTKLEDRNQIIDFSNDEKCRLTFKIIGYGKFKIDKIQITPKG